MRKPTRHERQALLLERDRLYAEHMYRDAQANFRDFDRVPSERDYERLRSKPGLFESLLLWLLG
jgi:hypothetical protein